MMSILIALIYLAFVSLGLPDSLLGSAWPVMHESFGAALSTAGLITMTISFGTIASSLGADALIRRLGVGRITAISTAMTAVALWGFSISTEIWQLILWAIPYGLGAGAVDAALNNYVALHYSSRHMSWLHGAWGVGAAISPNIMGYCLSGAMGWQSGYRMVSLLQFGLAAALIMSLPLWRRAARSDAENLGDSGKEPTTPATSLRQILQIPGVRYIIIAFFAYCAMETTAGLWAASYLVEYRGVDEYTAARFASLFYIGLTVGRYANGLIANRMGDRRMIRLGCIGALLGIGMILLPLKTDVVALAGLIVTGVGAAPIYPSIIHSTPDTFGAENSQAVIGVQMAGAYLGSTFMSPLFGVLTRIEGISLGLYPFYLLVFTLLMLYMSERVGREKKRSPTT